MMGQPPDTTGGVDGWCLSDMMAIRQAEPGSLFFSKRQFMTCKGEMARLLHMSDEGSMYVQLARLVAPGTRRGKGVVQ